MISNGVIAILTNAALPDIKTQKPTKPTMVMPNPIGNPKARRIRRMTKPSKPIANALIFSSIS